MRSVALQYLGTERLPDKEWVQSTMSPYRASFEREDGTLTQGYRLTKDWIINALAITPEEQQQLQLLINTQEKYRRKNAKRRSRRAKKTRAEYLDSAQQKKLLIQQLRVDHPHTTYRQLAIMANCSLGAVFNAIKT